jgi:hypothetical protein
MSAARGTPDLDLPPFELSLANSANPLIVERIPFSESISLTQDRESIVEFDMRSHHAKTLCASHRNRQSGRRMIV